jgi:tetratricopeptide (TPR) repeat protein
MPSSPGDRQAKAEEIKAEGNEKLAAKDYVSAEDLYSQAIDLCPEIEAYYTNRALARTNLKKFDLASEDCMAALRINPKSARAYGRLGSAMFQAEKFNDSREAYAKALEFDAENATYKQGMAAAEAKLKPVITKGVDDTAGAIQNMLSSALSSNGAATAPVSVNDKNADMGVGLSRSMRAKQVRHAGQPFPAPPPDKNQA